MPEEDEPEMEKLAPFDPDDAPLDQWKRLYQPPFRYDRTGTTVFDKNNHMVLQIRGWGRISSQLLSHDPSEGIAAETQDSFGTLVAFLLNQWYEKGLTA